MCCIPVGDGAYLTLTSILFLFKYLSSINYEDYNAFTGFWEHPYPAQMCTQKKRLSAKESLFYAQSKVSLFCAEDVKVSCNEYYENDNRSNPFKVELDSLCFGEFDTVTGVSFGNKVLPAPAFFVHTEAEEDK